MKNLKYAFGFSMLRISSLSLMKYLRDVSSIYDNGEVNSLPQAFQVSGEDRVFWKTGVKSAEHLRWKLEAGKVRMLMWREDWKEYLR